MKLSMIMLTIGACLGFCTANYHFNAQEIYELGVKDGYAHQRQSTLFVANSAYQRGWEDCYQLFKKRTKKTKTM